MKNASGAPVLQPDQVAHADLVDAGLAQAVGRLEPVAVVGLAAAQVIDRIALAVVRFLIDVDRVQPVIHQQAVLVGLERLHLERNLLEVLLDDLHRVGMYCTLDERGASPSRAEYVGTGLS